MFKVSRCTYPYSEYLFEEKDLYRAEQRARHYSFTHECVLMIEEADPNYMPIRLVRGGVLYEVSEGVEKGRNDDD